MRFLLDNDVPDTVGQILRQAGHEAVFLRDVISKRSSDDDVFRWAASQQLLLITCNRDDFVPLAREKSHAGLIVLIRRPTRITECRNLLRLLESAGDQGLAVNINFA